LAKIAENCELNIDPMSSSLKDFCHALGLIDEYGRPVRLVFDQVDEKLSTSFNLQLLVVADQSMTEFYFHENLQLYLQTLLGQVQDIFK
jgi:hypothetical protein